MESPIVIVVGSGNAALCAGISALEQGAAVLMLEKASAEEAGGNSRYSAGAMRFAYSNGDDLLEFLANPEDERIPLTNFGTYPADQFEQDLLDFNGKRPLSHQQTYMVHQSFETIWWLHSHGIKFEPIYKRQSFERKGKYVFWGGLTLAAQGEGAGLVKAEMTAFLRLGGSIHYETEAKALIHKDDKVQGVMCETPQGEIQFKADAVILACGGFEANPQMRKELLGDAWLKAKVRGTPHNRGKGIDMALDVGAILAGNLRGCHAVPMDLNMPNYGNLQISFLERKKYRKICYFLGIMLNEMGERFLDEGENFRNYTYAQFGRAVLNQPGAFAWQVFDQKVESLLYDEYRFWDASFVEANTLNELVQKLEGVDPKSALKTIKAYNQAVDDSVEFDPSILDGKSTKGLLINKTNWANVLDTPPFKAFPVTCGITFTYGGLKVNHRGAVLKEDEMEIPGLYACGEIVGNVFFEGYPGGSGLTSGAVFGRLAGKSAAL